MSFSTVWVYEIVCSHLHIIDKVASIINNIGLFTNENEKGPNFDLVNWGKNSVFSFTAGTSKRAHWNKCPTNQYLKKYPEMTDKLMGPNAVHNPIYFKNIHDT